MKLNKDPFGLRKSNMLGMAYVTPKSSTYNTEDCFIVRYEELTSLPDKTDVLIYGDFNSRTSNFPDYLEPDTQGGWWPINTPP